MVYNYYIEGYSNGIFHRIHLEGYKTKKLAEIARCKTLENNKIAEIGRCLYTFSGNENRKYSKNEYSVLERFNCKAFFDFW